MSTEQDAKLQHQHNLLETLMAEFRSLKSTEESTDCWVLRQFRAPASVKATTAKITAAAEAANFVPFGASMFPSTKLPRQVWFLAHGSDLVAIALRGDAKVPELEVYFLRSEVTKVVVFDFVSVIAEIMHSVDLCNLIVSTVDSYRTAVEHSRVGQKIRFNGWTNYDGICQLFDALVNPKDQAYVTLKVWLDKKRGQSFLDTSRVRNPVKPGRAKSVMTYAR